MRKVLKWIGIVMGVLVLLIAAAMIVVYITTDSRMNQLYAVTPSAVSIPADSGSILEGKRLVLLKGCTECHGMDMAGDTVFDESFIIGQAFGSNLTRGAGSRTANYTDADWVRAICYGVRPDGLPLVIMPSNEFWGLNDRDLGCIIAYCKSLPAVDRQLPELSIGPIPRAQVALGSVSLAVEMLDLNKPRPTGPPPGVTVEYGGYLAQTCVGCHGGHFSGGPIPGAPPDWVPPANLTPSGEMKGWSDDQIIAAIQTGRRPDGRVLDPVRMPWPSFKSYSNEEIRALLLFLRSLPPHPAGQR